MAVSPFFTSARRTACRATAIGSVNAAMSAGSPLGTGKVSEASTRTRSAYPPGANGDSPVNWTAPWERTSGKETTVIPSRSFLGVLRPRSEITPQNSWPITVGVSRRMKSG